MSEANRAAIDQAPGILSRVAGFVDDASIVGATVLAGLTFAATVAEAIDTSAAVAQEPTTTLDIHAVATTSRTRQVEEYASITTKNALGVTMRPQFGQFVLLEECRDGSSTVHRKVTYDKTEQPLGDCNVGSNVTVTVKPPPGGEWQNKTPSKKVLKATRKNNGRFAFTEQELTPTPAPSTPQPTPPVPTPPANTQTSPTTPPPPPPPPPSSDQTIEVNTGASDSSGDTIPTPSDTFQYDWTCNGVDEGIVTLESDPQVLGSCPEGDGGTVTEEAPLGTQKWTELLTNPQSFSVGSATVEVAFKDQENAAPPPPPEDPYISGEVGVDISWPQCVDGDEAPPSSAYSGAQFAIIGLNGGLEFEPNPCASAETGDFSASVITYYANVEWNSAGSHVNTTNPDTCAVGDEDCAAYDTGYQAGLYDLSVMKAITSTKPGIVWLDVEPPSISTWSSDTVQNQNNLQGTEDALATDGLETGIYGTTTGWGEVADGLQDDLPSWGATTWTTASGAASYCMGHQFTGGPSYLMQFTPTSELDEDYAC